MMLSSSCCTTICRHASSGHRQTALLHVTVTCALSHATHSIFSPCVWVEAAPVGLCRQDHIALHEILVARHKTHVTFSRGSVPVWSAHSEWLSVRAETVIDHRVPLLQSCDGSSAGSPGTTAPGRRTSATPGLVRHFDCLSCGSLAHSMILRRIACMRAAYVHVGHERCAACEVRVAFAAWTPYSSKDVGEASTSRGICDGI